MRKINLIDISRFDLNLSITFLALWEERSVTVAARKLSLSQSAVSAALLRLREAAGDPLFVRTKDGMQPTERATAMAESIHVGVSQIRHAFMPVSAFDPASSQAHFTLGMSDDYQLTIAPALMRRLAKTAPGVSVTFRQTNQHTVETAFEKSELDFAIVAGDRARAGLVHCALGASGYACLLDPVACGVTLPLTLDDYLRLPHVLVSYSGRAGIVDQVLRKSGLKRHVQTALTHFSALPPFLIDTPAVATLPTHAAAALARTCGLATCPPPIELGGYGVSLYWQKTTNNTWMRDIICNTCIEEIELLMIQDTSS